MARDKSGTHGEKAVVVRLQPQRRCPICGRDAAPTHYPFCSRRCADVDLNRWFSGAYAIPAVEGEGSSEQDDGDD